MSILEIRGILVGLSSLVGFSNDRLSRLPNNIELAAIALAASLLVVMIEFDTPVTQITAVASGILLQIDCRRNVMNGKLSRLVRES